MRRRKSDSHEFLSLEVNRFAANENSNDLLALALVSGAYELRCRGPSPLAADQERRDGGSFWWATLEVRPL